MFILKNNIELQVYEMKFDQFARFRSVNKQNIQIPEMLSLIKSFFFMDISKAKINY